MVEEDDPTQAWETHTHVGGVKEYSQGSVVSKDGVVNFSTRVASSKWGGWVRRGTKIGDRGITRNIGINGSHAWWDIIHIRIVRNYHGFYLEKMSEHS